MNKFSVNTFRALATIHQPQSISIYIPTHRSGQEVNEKVDRINLKNQIQHVAKKLEAWQLDNRAIEQLLSPMNKLVDDSGFWNNLAEGLAIFCNKDHFEYYILPVEFNEFNYVSDHFYLLPLISYLRDDYKYYLLALSLSDVKVFDGSFHHINEVQAHDLMPGQLEEAVGYDFKEKNLQFRTGQTDTNNALYHGQGKGSEEEKDEIKRYFRAINKGLMKLIKNSKRPLVVATVDYLFPIYKEVNDYPYLWKGFIAGNPEHTDPASLHNSAMALLQDHFSKDRRGFWDAFENAQKNDLVSFDEKEIIPAAFNRQIETLIVKKHETLWGLYDPEKNTLKPREQQSQFKSCLLNFAAVHTILNGGRVYLMEAGEMPEPGSKLNAIFRYSQ